jgi:hypothetical protein
MWQENLVVFSLITLGGSCLYFSRQQLQRASQQLPEQNRWHMTMLLRNSLPIILLLTILYFAFLVLAYTQFPLWRPWLAVLVPAAYVLLFILMHLRQRQAMLRSGIPDGYCRLFLLSRLTLLTGLLFFGALLQYYIIIKS